MAEPRVLIFGQDIYALGYVPRIDNILERKTFRKDKLVANTYDLTVDNSDDYFSINNSRSPFNNSNWLWTPIQVYNRDEELVWDGNLWRIDRNHNTKTAVLKSKNAFYEFRKTMIEYESSTWETPATAFKNLCDAYGYTNYNEASVSKSISQYEDAGCYIKCNFNISDNVTFQHAIEKIGEYGNADVYAHLNDTYFVHWVPFTGGVSILLDATERDKLKSLPIVTEDETTLFNDYSIGYDGDGGVAAIDSANGNIGNISRTKWGVHSLPELRSDIDAQIRYQNLTSAVYIGEGYIRRTHKNLLKQPQPLTAIRFNIFSDNKEWITLQSYFNHTLPDESWTAKTFEVFEFTINEEEDDIEIFAYETV
jgi:hypothetical protein